MAKRGLVKQVDATRIGKVVRIVEGSTILNSGNLTRPSAGQRGIPAEITAISDLGGGLYKAKEIQINKDGDEFVEPDFNPRLWDGLALPEVFELNAIEDLEVGQKIYLFSQGGKTVGFNKWFFNGGSAASKSGGSFGVQNHISINVDTKKLEFVNDVAEAATDIAFGPALYGELYNANVAWRFLFDKNSLANGYIVPQFGAESGGGGIDFGIKNARHIQMYNLQGEGNQGDFLQTLIFHDRLPEAETATNTAEMWTGHLDADDEGILVLDRETYNNLPAATALTTDNLPVWHAQIDILGHFVKINGSTGGTTPYPPVDPPVSFLLIVAYTGTYPSNPPLHAADIGQDTTITNGIGVDVGAGNGLAGNPNRLRYNVRTGQNSIVGASLTGGIPQNPFFQGNSTNFVGGKFGNNTDVTHDLSRYFNTTIVLSGDDQFNLTKGASDTIDTDTLYLEVPTFVGVPSSSTDFTIEFQLLDIAGGAQFTKFDGTGFYEVVAFLFWATDARDANGIPLVPLQEERADVIAYNGGTKSGASIIDFNIIIAATDTEQLCCVWFVNHKNVAAPPATHGFIFDGGQTFLNNFTCEDTNQTGDFTCTVTPVPQLILFDNFTEKLAGGEPMADLTVPVVYLLSIQKAGVDTNEFSQAGKQVKIELEDNNGTPLSVFSIDPTFGSFSKSITDNVLANTGAGGTTDGFTLTFEGLGITAGQNIGIGEWTIITTLDGCSDSPIKTIFTVDGTSSIFYWSDQWDGTGENSATIGGPNYTLRWLENISGGELNIIADTLEQGAITTTADTATLENKVPDIGISADDKWLINNNYIDINIPAAAIEIHQSLVVTTSNKTYEIGYFRENGESGQSFGININNAATTAFFLDSDNTAKVEIARDDYQMSDDFTGEDQNSGDIVEGPDRWAQRWQFNAFDVPVFTYDLVEQTPRTVNVYDSQAGTPDDLVEVYDSQAGTPDDIQFKYGAINLRRNLFGAIVTTSTRAAGAVLTLTDFSSSGSGTETTGVDVVETEILNQVSVLTMGIRMITTNNDTSGRLKFGSPSGIEYSSTNDFTSFDNITTSSIYLGVLCFDETWSTGDDTNVVEFVYPQTLPIIELSVGVVNSDSSSNFKYKFQIIRTTQGATTVMYESVEIETGTTGWTSTGAGGFEKDIVTDITAEVLENLPKVYQT